MLTDAWLLENAGIVSASVREVTDGHGLSARVSAKGKVVFQIRYRFHHKPVRLDLGIYPSMSLHRARLENERLRRFLRNNVDPRAVVAREREAKSNRKTIARHGPLRREMAEFLQVVNRSKIPRRSKRFLQECISVVASLEDSHRP